MNGTEDFIPEAEPLKSPQAVDGGFDESGAKEKLGKDDEIVQGAVASVRRQLKQPMKTGSNLPELHFPDDVVAKLVEISQEHELPRERRDLAVLAALLEATEPQTPETLTQRTGYATGQMVGTIGSLNRVLLKETSWKIEGRSTTGWTIRKTR